jgi:hypothetical protein
VRPYLEKSHHKKGLAEWVKVKALSSNPSTSKKKKKNKKPPTQNKHKKNPVFTNINVVQNFFSDHNAIRYQ